MKIRPTRLLPPLLATKRCGIVFARCATTAAAFSARSRPGLGVSMPVAWEQLMALKGGAQWTITTAREYLSFEQKDPWADYWTTAQTLAEGMKILGYKPSGRRNATGDKV